MRLEHPIFNTPLQAGVVLDADHPYEDAKDGQGTWLVHSGDFRSGCDVGMVSDGHGFEDSPDCERISGGVNSKGPRALAIGRQANLLQWGFYGAPDRMTDSAKRAFLNAIVYMRRFENHVPLTTKAGRGRSWLEQYIDMAAALSPDALAKAEGYASYLIKQFPPELTKGELDTTKLRAWYAASVEYLRAEGRGGRIDVDKDLASLELSNRKPEFLDYILSSLATDPEDQKALALARRYLPPEACTSSTTITTYITSNRPFLFFSDTGGYRWFVDTNARKLAGKKPADAGRTPGDGSR